MTDSVVLRDLRKSYGRQEVLGGLNLNIAEGKMYGLVGPNGSGKTTIFRILMGLTDATSGDVSVLGMPPGVIGVRRSTGYMTQAEALYKDLSVSENVRFFGRLFGLSGRALHDATEAAIRLVDLTDRAKSRVDSLSGGMRRRTSLACAVVHRPRLLLLDEPTVGVDPELRALFWDTFAAWGKRGTTLIVSTHHLDEASRCDTLGLLRAGRLIAEGTPRELLSESGADTLENAFLAFARRRQ
ncbi:MAG TPA: ABC transporter ATP-binding protein [Myxococcota bacterium]|nr:ABC transporter ATP-binding protein [Myxococcota bacterium]